MSLFMQSDVLKTHAMNRFAAFAITAFAVSILHAQERETGDFNFDGHQDYRVFRSSDGKRHFYDHFLFDPKTKKHMLSTELSSLFNPVFDSKTREIHCIWPGGHSGAIFYEEDYAWQNGKLTFLRTVRQTDVDFGDGRIRYVRVTSVLDEGKPKIETIERGRTPNE